MDRSHRSVHDGHRRAGGAVRRRTATSSSRTRSTRRPLAAVDARSRRRSARARSSSKANPTAGSASPASTRRRSRRISSSRPMVLRDFCAHPLLAGLCRDLVGPDVRLYWDQAVYKQPHSAEPVLWHQDNGYTFVEPQAYLTCWIAHHRRDARERLRRRDAGRAPRRHAAHDTPIGYECWGDQTAAVEVPGAARAASSCSRRSRRTTPRATRPTTCARPTSCSTRPTAPSRTARQPDGTAGRPNRSTTIAGSSPSCAAACPSRA